MIICWFLQIISTENTEYENCFSLAENWSFVLTYSFKIQPAKQLYLQMNDEKGQIYASI